MRRGTGEYCEPAHFRAGGRPAAAGAGRASRFWIPCHRPSVALHGMKVHSGSRLIAHPCAGRD